MKVIRIRHTALAAALALTAATAQAGLLDSLFGGSSSEQARQGQRSWRIAEFTYVRLVPIEAGAEPNGHPVRIEPEQLRTLLSTVRLPGAQEGRGEPLFDTEELGELIGPLSQALGLAGAGDDVTLLSTSRRGEGFLTQPRAVTARLFVRDGQLQLLAKDTRREFMSTYRGTQIEPKFEFGSRSAPSSAVLTSSLSTSSRPDWLRLPLNAMPAPAAPAAAAVVPPPAPAAAAVPGAVAAPAAAPVATPAPMVKPAARDEAFYEAQEVRLKALKRLFDKGLITEAEYQQQRRDIISGL